MSNEERASWVSLLVHLAVGYWYFSRMLALPPEAATFARQALFITALISFAIIVAIASEIALRIIQRQRGDVPDSKPRRDERDVLISLKSTRTAHFVLLSGIAGVWTWMGLLEAGWWRRLHPLVSPPDTVLDALVTGPASPGIIAQLLLAALTLASIALYASRIYHYRRGW